MWCPSGKCLQLLVTENVTSGDLCFWFLSHIMSIASDLDVAALTGSHLRGIRASVSELSRPFLQGGEVIVYLQFQASCSSRAEAEEETGACVTTCFFVKQKDFPLKSASVQLTETVTWLLLAEKNQEK